MAIYTNNKISADNTTSDSSLEELVQTLQQRLDLPEDKIRSILASAIRFIELKHPQYLPVLHQLGFDAFATGRENHHE